VDNLKTAMEGEDADEIKRLSEELQQASHKLAEAIYAQTAQQEAAGQAGPGPGPEADSGAAEDEDVVDADFEEVKK
jgi:molecular chaperone DnaK